MTAPKAPRIPAGKTTINSTESTAGAAADVAESATKALPEAASRALPAATDAIGAATNAASEAAAGFTRTLDETVEHIRSFNEELIESAKQAGIFSLDTYEKTLSTLLELEERIGTASQLDWVTELTQAHVAFITEISRPLISAARDALE